MVSIYRYNDGTAYFTCCDKHYHYDFADKLSADCVFDVEIMCPNCGQKKVLYVLRCCNAAIAKELNAQLEVLRLRRKAVEDNGYQNNEQNQN